MVPTAKGICFQHELNYQNIIKRFQGLLGNITERSTGEGNEKKTG